MGKWILILVLVYAIPAFSYCTPDNETCFECGTNCVAELTFENVLQDDGTNKKVGTFTVYGTGENASGEMGRYNATGTEPNRTTTAPWKDKLSDINHIVVSKGVTNIGKYAFSGAKNLDHLELPESVKNIGYYAFMDSELKSVNTLKHVDSIGDGGFYRTNLENIDLSDNLTEIGYATFGITQLSNLFIPDSVEKIGNLALLGLPAAAKVYCNNENDRCDALFYGDTDTGLESEKLVKYTKKDGFYQTEDGKLFANLDLMAHGAACSSAANCAEILAAANAGTPFQVGSKIYNSLDDFAKGNNVKFRIYTIDEANKIAGKINTFSIKYR